MVILVVHLFATLKEKLFSLQQCHGDISVHLMDILGCMFKSINIIIGLNKVNKACGLFRILIKFLVTTNCNEIVCENGGFCDPESKECNCLDGFIGSRCETGKN